MLTIAHQRFLYTRRQSRDFRHLVVTSRKVKVTGALLDITGEESSKRLFIADPYLTILVDGWKSKFIKTFTIETKSTKLKSKNLSFT